MLAEAEVVVCKAGPMYLFYDRCRVAGLLLYVTFHFTGCDTFLPFDEMYLLMSAYCLMLAIM